MTIADVVLGAILVAAHHGLRRRSAVRDPQDAAPYPRLAWDGRLWSCVYDITAALGHPAAPSEWTVRR